MKPPKQPITIQTPQGIRTAGYIEHLPNGIALTKTVKASRHLLKKPPSWAMDKHALMVAKEAGASQVIITDKDTGYIYTGYLKDFDNGFEFDRGYGLQVGLPIKKFKCHAPVSIRPKDCLSGPAMVGEKEEQGGLF